MAGYLRPEVLLEATNNPDRVKAWRNAMATSGLPLVIGTMVGAELGTYKLYSEANTDVSRFWAVMKTEAPVSPADSASMPQCSPPVAYGPGMSKPQAVEPYPVLFPRSVGLCIQDHSQAVSAMAQSITGRKDAWIISGGLLEAIRATERSLERLRAVHLHLLETDKAPVPNSTTTQE